MTPPPRPARPTRTTWIRATALGWLLGVPAVILLSVLAESLGAEHLNTPVGAGMGLGLGIAQWFALRRHLSRATRWIAATAPGLAAPFAVSDLARVANLGLPYSLYVAAPIGGVLMAIGQAFLVRTIGVRPVTWVVATVVGWGAACGAIGVADWMFQHRVVAGVAGMWSYLSLLCLGGVFLGIGGAIVLGKRAATRLPVSGRVIES